MNAERKEPTVTVNAASAHRKSPRSPLRGFLSLLLRQPLWAIPFALFFGTLFGGVWPAYVQAYEVSLVFAYSIGVAMWAMRHYGEPRMTRRVAGTRDGWRIGAAYAFAALLSSYVAAVIVHFTILPGFLGSARSVLISGMFTLVFVALFTGINLAMAFYREAVERARAVEQVRAELAQAELRALRAQIHPHFLFNTLNTIAALIASDPGAAEDIVTRLAELFRYTLTASGRESVPFGEELAFLRNYLAIERARFGERLRIEESLGPGVESVPVPSLLLQPLIENAVRHGVASRESGGTVRLHAAISAGTLVVEIADDGPGMDGETERAGAGFGLHSVRERLRAAGPPHAIEIESAPGAGTRARVTLPLEPHGVAPGPAASGGNS
jgi:two-component system LytT family sensor kinase